MTMKTNINGHKAATEESIAPHICSINNQWTMPGEWIKQKAVQLTWPHANSDWRDMLDEVTETFVCLATEISKRQQLIVVTPDKSLVPNLKNTTIVQCQTNDTWARDHAFVSLTKGDEIKLIDFKFNGWGEKFEASLDNDINRQLIEKGVINGIYCNQLDFVLEGGSIESDNNGTLFTTTNCLMAPHRNQPMTKQQIEQRLKTTLGMDRVVWIDHGMLVGDDTDGHIDTLVRTAPDNTLVYMGCDNKTDEQYDELMKMEQQLKTVTNKNGQPYRLLRLPSPHPIYCNGERLPATYANYLPINGAVLYPTYAQDDNDNEAAKVIAMAYPDREIIGVDCRSLIKQHGSLHCCTMQYF